MAEDKKLSEDEILTLLENFGHTLETLSHAVRVERDITSALVGLAHTAGWNIKDFLDLAQTVAAQKSAESSAQERLHAAYNTRVAELLASLGRKAN